MLRNFLIGEVQLLCQSARPLLGGFLRPHQLIDRPQGAFLTEQPGLDLFVYWYLCDQHFHVNFQNRVHGREQAHQKQVIYRLQPGCE